MIEDSILYLFHKHIKVIDLYFYDLLIRASSQVYGYNQGLVIKIGSSSKMQIHKKHEGRRGRKTSDVSCSWGSLVFNQGLG